MKRFLVLLLLASLSVSSAVAGVETAKYRVTGLFSKDREADLRMVMNDLPDVTLVSVDFDHAEATFTYDPALTFKGAKPEDIQKRFDEKVRTASNGTFGIQPLCATPKDQLTQIEIPVIGLDCKACSFAAYEVIAKIDGVAQATASFKEGRITALIDPVKTNRATLESALEKKQVKLKRPEK